LNKVPSVGESITSGILGVWSKPDRRLRQIGRAIFEIETDKSRPKSSPKARAKLKHLVKAGDTVQIGQVVASIDEKAPAPKEAAPAAKTDAGNGAKEKASRAPAEGH